MSLAQRDYEAESNLVRALASVKFTRLKSLKPTCFRSIDSTQEYVSNALQSDRAGESAGARLQTAGKGREGRLWVSDDGGVWMSITLRPTSANLLGDLAINVSESVAETLKEYGVKDCAVKPPNDVYCMGRKIGGVLVDSVILGSKCIAYVGIGVNVNNDVSSNPFIAGIATSLKQVLHEEVSLTDFIVRLLKNVDRNYDALIRSTQ